MAPNDRPVKFPVTRLSVLDAARSPDPATRTRGLETLIAAYWKPAYKYVRLKWQASPEDAQDLTQEFFARAIEKGFFDPYDPDRARFRTFLRTCLDGFVANERKAGRRMKRGGGIPFVSLDFETAEGELRSHEPAVPADMDEYFHREWIRHLLGLVVDDLRHECKAAGKDLHFRIFARYDLDDPEPDERRTYRQLADELGVSVSDVTNHLAWARREFRRLLLDRLRSLCATDEEFRGEARAILGVDPR